MKNKGILVVISGFSGVGKGTIVKELLSQYDNYAVSVSATTRAPRVGEEDGVAYFFKKKEEFEQMIKDNALLEYAQYVEHYYGTPRDYVEKQLNGGKDVILEIEIQGALQVKKQYPETLMVFIVPPSAATLKERLIGRGTEELFVIESRLKRAAEESEEMDKYEYLIVNDDLDTAVKEVHALIQSQHGQVNRNKDFMKNMQKEMQEFVKGE